MTRLPSVPEPTITANVRLGDRVWSILLTAFGGAVLVVAGLIVIELTHVAQPLSGAVSLWKFLAGADWDPVNDSYGALPYIYGTLVTSAVAIALAGAVGVGIALFLTEMAPPQLRAIAMFPLELLAGIPSIVYGLWGLTVLVPILRADVEPWLQRNLGFLPLFKGAPIGLGYLAAGVLLAIMILPTIASITVEVMRTVPGTLREAALALGATRWEAVKLSVLPYARPGIVGALILGLGRALGETMAVTMVIGNSPTISASLFAPGYSLPSVIANEFAEASGQTHTAALAGLGLILFGVTMALNAIARLLVAWASRGPLRKS
ncbi:MAG: phosphate ABC transporter permease subunit PstC [Deltaproteobacteria bacterium]|nr:phosphate ABC transporter permease subunit PstC [Deltaproteobacteria bacterium]